MSYERILTHMNKDHSTSLHDYLEYYGGIHIDVDAPNKVELTEVTLNDITLAYTKHGITKSVVVPLEPPMASLADACTRFIDMAFEAAKGLHVSPYRIKRFVPPETPGAKALFWALGLVSHGTGVLAFVPGAAALAPLARFVPVLRAIYVVTLAIHLGEYFVDAVPLLRRFRAPRQLWWTYLAAVLFTGFPAWRPLSHEAAKLTARAEAK